MKDNNKFFCLTLTTLLLEKEEQKVTVYIGHDYYLDETVYVKLIKNHDLTNIVHQETLVFIKKYIQFYSEIINIYNKEFDKNFNIKDLLLINIDNTYKNKDFSLDYSLKTNNRIKTIDHININNFKKTSISKKDVQSMLTNNPHRISWKDLPIHMKNKLFQTIAITSTNNFNPFNYFVELDYTNFIDN